MSMGLAKRAWEPHYKRSRFIKLPQSNITILEYGYVSTEVHFPLIAHKRTKQGSFRRDHRIGHRRRHTELEKAFTYGIDVSDTAKDIGVEVDQNSLTFTENYIYLDF